ncbi:unnamed protein product [Chondrus crispus]|uniref:Uncharacterized protein n=1 Tax=Chondrus crispus TaxID=2769 RepID=R7Q8V7_CHOCR|nr:unnamed protein product [Chondrus crispus]CDF34952.1 unnamed protein product [Chondrus crispus]|eukprot:XP_005714771.1 unnamed protein product [Chondrus crispus]
MTFVTLLFRHKKNCWKGTRTNCVALSILTPFSQGIFFFLAWETLACSQTEEGATMPMVCIERNSLLDSNGGDGGALEV